MSKHLPHHLNEQPPQDTLAPHDSGAIPAPAAAGALYKLAETGRVLKNATAAIEKQAQEATGRNDLTLMHCLVLVHLLRSPTCRQVELKSATGITPANLTKLVDELHHENLVARIRSYSDRRQMILMLTEQGRETASRLLAALNDVSDTPRSQP